MKQHNALLRSAAVLTGVGLLSQAFSFFYHIAIARLAGAETLGLVQLILPLYEVMQSLCISGLSSAVAVLTSEFHARHDETGVRQVLSAGLFCLVLCWIPAALLLSSQSHFFSEVLLGDGRTKSGLLLLLPALLLTGTESLEKQHCYGVGLLRLPAVVEVAEQLTRCAAIVTLLLLIEPSRPSVAAALVMLGFLFSEVVSSLSLTLGCRSKVAVSGPSLPKKDLFRKISKIALPVTAAALTANLMHAVASVMIPQLLMQWGRSPQSALEDFGMLTGVTLPFLSIPSAFVNGLVLALLPRLVSLRKAGNRSAFYSTAVQSLRWVSCLVFPAIAVLASLGKALGPILFHDLRAADHLVSLAFAVGLSCCHAVMICILHAAGKQTSCAFLSLICGGLQLILTLLLTITLGLTGAILGMILPELLAILGSLRILKRHSLTFPLYSGLVGPLLSALVAGLITNLTHLHIQSAGGSLAQALCVGLALGIVADVLTLKAQGLLFPNCPGRLSEQRFI